MKFIDKLNGTIKRNQSLLWMPLDPNPDVWSESCGTRETVSNHFWWDWQEWLQFLVTETVDLVCTYKLTLEFYRALGSVGLELLHSTLTAIPDSIPVILDAQYSGLNTSTIFAQTTFTDWRVDAVTLNPYTGQDEVAPFLLYTDQAVFILCATDNPSASVLQTYPTVESPFYLQLVQEARTWGIAEQVGLVVGGTPEILARIRALAPERLILINDLIDNTDLTKTLEAGLNANGDGLIVPVPQELLGNKSPQKALRSWRDQINQVRHQLVQESPACSLWLPDVCFLGEHPHKDLILQLYDLGCIQFGEYVQASGATFPYYIDLRTIISHPQVFEQVLSAYSSILANLSFDRIAGIPYGSLPTATGLGLRLSVPMIFPRKEVKAHGTRRLVEGKFQPGESIVVIDDVLITGRSILEGAAKLESVGLRVWDLVVFIDHEEGVTDRLAQAGYRGHAVLTISEIAQTLWEAGRLTPAQFNALEKTTASG